MNKNFNNIFLVGLAILIIFTACSPKESSEPVETTIEDSSHLEIHEKEIENSEAIETEIDDVVEDEPESIYNEKLASLYEEVLDSIDTYKFTSYPEKGESVYLYALIDINDNADIPQLLVVQINEVGFNHLKIFNPNYDFTQTITSFEELPLGASSNTFFKTTLSLNKDQDSLLYTSFSSGTGQATIEEITTSIENNIMNLNRNTVWEGLIDDTNEDDSLSIEFLDVSDRSFLEKLKSTPDSDFLKSFISENEKNQSDSLDRKIKEELNEGKMVVSGKVRIFEHNEMLEYQGFDREDLYSSDLSYIVLIMEKPLDLNLVSGDGQDYRVRNTNLIDLPDYMNVYEGQNITISFSPDDGRWQSDFSFPMDAARMKNVNVLN